MKLLIIEDEPALLLSMKRYLGKEGYTCEEAVDFDEAVEKIQQYKYNALIIDLNLPGGDGMELVRIARRLDKEVGIVIVSARNSLDDKLIGLDTGSDDYLTKPFHLSELNARLKALLRRKHFFGEQVFQLEELEIAVERREVKVCGQPLKLTRKEFDLLLYLARNRNRVVTKDSLAEHLWGDYMVDAVSLDFIYSHVKNLRRKIVAAGGEDRIASIYGVGYKFVL